MKTKSIKSAFRFCKLSVICFIFIFSCKKDDEVKFDSTPSIEFVSISPLSATQYTDAVTITLKYKDGDGDLGENFSSAENCFITDNRIGIIYKYRIPQLAPNNANVPIQGTLNIPLGGQIITDSTNAQTVTFTLYVRDRAGNQSNSVTTSAITIRK